MPVTIDRRLNLIVPLGDGGNALQVHSTPIPREVFERYWAPITRSFNYAVTTAGGSAPRIAALALKEVSEQMGIWEDEKSPNGDVKKPGVKNGLLAEIRRLTNVIVYEGQAGWVPLPLDVAEQQKKLDADEAREVESAVVFFTLASWAISKRDLPEFYETGCGIPRARAALLTSTELAHSLRTSTATVSSGPKVAASVPS